MRLILGRRANFDLVRILERTAESNPTGARNLAAKLSAAFKRLRKHPEIGQPCDLAPELRVLPVVVDAVYYRVRADGVEIVRVLHAARDQGTAFEDAS